MAARNSQLATGHGPLQLPAYFPDATRGVVRSVDSPDLVGCGVRGLVVNTLHLSHNPGVGLIKAAGGIHRFMGWDRPIASDSGGFQLLSMIRSNPRYGTISDRGIHFIDTDRGNQRTLFTPERSIRIQFDLGADLMVCLDDCPRPDASPVENAATVDRTIAWAARCRAEYDRLLTARGHQFTVRPLLFAVVQGGYDPDQRARCAEGLLPLGFDGYGFGGWPLRPDGTLADDILALTASLTPDDRPRFALGLGKPENILRCHRLGWQIFDCVLPTRDARHGRLYVWNEPTPNPLAPDFYHLTYVRDAKHKRQNRPISSGCDCHTCQHFSLGYLHHLFDIGDPLAMRLASIHNLRFYTRLLEQIAACKQQP
ncbi:MAG: queuine tRNA-ribosyltransferase family protein [Chloroflexi bacterium]|nr:queuine tRNA-ribosyltransferase family protein [Chloroflexota bacterium]MBU1878644.1 queuine tRNA-ribosyltransferase family protein [Chloroflexota bacterium]